MAVMDLQARDKHHTAIKASHVTASASIIFVTAASNQTTHAQTVLVMK